LSEAVVKMTGTDQHRKKHAVEVIGGIIIGPTYGGLIGG
jgi:hypothetical protein